MHLQKPRTTGVAASRLGVHEPFPASTPPEKEFRELYLRCERKALAIAELYVGRDEAEDVLQEVAIRMYGEWNSLPPEAHGDGYFLKAIRHKAIDHHRRDSKYEALPENLDELESLHVPAPDPVTGQLNTLDVLTPVVQALPEQRRRVWLMRTQGMSNQEIAERLQIDAQVVRKYMRMATAEVMAALEKGGILPSFETLLAALPEKTPEATDE